MEIVFQILQQLPSGWSRIAVLVGLAALFFLPEMRRNVTWRLWDHERLERAKQLLELRQLELEVEELKAQHPESTNEFLDTQIKALLDRAPAKPLSEPIAWTHRLKYALCGSLALMILGTIVLWQSGRFVDESAIWVICVELGYAAVAGFLAAAIPARYVWECVFRGFLIPAILGALLAAATGDGEDKAPKANPVVARSDVTGQSAAMPCPTKGLGPARSSSTGPSASHEIALF